jgi:hypothetical protein
MPRDIASRKLFALLISAVPPNISAMLALAHARPSIAEHELALQCRYVRSHSRNSPWTAGI